jgi:signal transduction histidine kinase
MAQELDGSVEISVQDTGIGIKTSDQEKIFDKFYRSSDEKVREQTGYGLGLALAQQIIHMHHGKLSLESEYGKWTTFKILLEKASGPLMQEGVA